jgi:PTS system fructose-specific IIC component
MMLGGAVTGAISMAAGAELKAPHGGIFVLFAITGIPMFLIALLVGTVVGAVAVTAAKRFVRPGTEEPSAAPVATVA